MRALVVALVVVTGCLSATQRREDNLVREARLFNDDFRWARWEAMTTAMPRDDGQMFMGRVGDVGEDLVLADYEVTSITFTDGSRGAKVAVKVEWYMKREPTVKASFLEQRWEFREGRWLMVQQRRTRGDRFPLVTEPAPTPAEGQ